MPGPGSAAIYPRTTNKRLSSETDRSCIFFGPTSAPITHCVVQSRLKAVSKPVAQASSLCRWTDAKLAQPRSNTFVLKQPFANEHIPMVEPKQTEKSIFLAAVEIDADEKR